MAAPSDRGIDQVDDRDLAVASPRDTPLPPVCTAGAVPKPDFLHRATWVGLTYLPAEITNMLTEGGLGWIVGIVAPVLMNADDLCANANTVPLAFTDADWETKVADVLSTAFPGAPFMAKLWEWAKYGAFQTWCQCNSPQPPVTPPVTPPGGVSGNGCVAVTPQQFHGCQFGGEYYVYVQGMHSTYQPVSLTLWDSDWNPPVSQDPSNCPQSDPRLTYVPLNYTGSFPSFTIEDGLYGPFNVSPGANGIFTGECWIQLISTASPQSSNSWSGDWWPYSSCALPPAPQPPQVYTPPTAPTNPCDATTLCNISWLIATLNQNTIQVSTNSNTQVTNITNGTAPVTALSPGYVTGTVHQVQNSGEVDVAQGTLGVSVGLTVIPPSISPAPSDPPYYSDVGWVVVGGPVGYEGKNWLHTDGQLVFPRSKIVTRVAYNLTSGVIATITELVPPSVPAP